MSSTHHISRLSYQVACADEAQAFELRNLLSAITTEQLAAGLEEIADRYVGPDEFVRIPRLEINLLSTSLNTLSEELRTLFGHMLEEELRWRAQTGSGADPVADQREQELNALFYFLEMGTLPHWAASLPFDINGVIKHLVATQQDRLRAFLRQQQNAVTVWSRVDAQTTADVRELIVDIVPELSDAFLALKADYNAARNSDVPAYQALPPESVMSSPMLRTLLRNAPAILSKAIDRAALFQNFIAEISEAGAVKPTDEPAHTALSDQPLPGEMTPADMPLVTACAATLDLLMPAAPGATPEKIAVRSAGIVLLHPFLKPFFTELKLVSDGEWMGKDAQQRAAHILHHLAAGLQEQAEWKLTLEKLICGLLPDMPIERNVPLRDEELEECDQLLKAVIQHWAALKNTSPAGLRETFFKRDGLLERTDRGWQLRVERKTQDILLEALPWTYSMIQLPWNEYLIEVLW